MKNKIFLSMLFGLFSIVPLTSCGGDDDDDVVKPSETVNPGKNVADPEGTVTINMACSDSRDDRVYIQGFNTSMGINNVGNFWGASFVDLGAMKGLGNVKTIPESGWNEEVAVFVGHGYVAKYTYYSEKYYCRIYVDSAILSTSGGVLGYKVKVQAPFVP